MELVSKMQLGSYEQGEFSAEQLRSPEQTVQLIEDFPWQEERQYIHTREGIKPAVVIAGNTGDFLKLTSYYNGKFQLMYLNASGKEFAKAVSSVSEAMPFMDAFFEGSFSYIGFTSQQNVFSRLKDYRTKDFIYAPTLRQLFWFALIKTDLWMFPLIPIFSAILVPSPPSILIRSSIMLLLFFPILIYIFTFLANHYRYTKNKIIQISKSDRFFYYGEKGNLRRYSKDDIREGMIKVFKSVRSPIYDGIQFAKLVFRNGEVLIIPQMLVLEDHLSEKFAGCPIKEVKKTPFIRKKDFKPQLQEVS